MQNFLSYFLDEKLHYATFYSREKKIEERKTLKKVKGKRILETPVYILTSANTASGCESFTYYLQNRHRVTIVGETTTGASHAVKTFDIVDRFRMFMPSISLIDPISGSNFENTGITPDVRWRADTALDKAIELITNK